MKPLVSCFVVGVALALPSAVLASRGGTDIVVPVPADAWGAAREQNYQCLRCCVYENRNYSEGAVVKVDGVTLQCVRDKQVVGTNDLIWQPFKQ